MLWDAGSARRRCRAAGSARRTWRAAGSPGRRRGVHELERHYFSVPDSGRQPASAAIVTPCALALRLAACGEQLLG
eukprot:6555359-Prymnesium_polylepis.1